MYGNVAYYSDGWVDGCLSAKFWMNCCIMDCITGSDPDPDWPPEFGSLQARFKWGPAPTCSYSVRVC